VSGWGPQVVVLVIALWLTWKAIRRQHCVPSLGDTRTSLPLQAMDGHALRASNTFKKRSLPAAFALARSPPGPNNRYRRGMGEWHWGRLKMTSRRFATLAALCATVALAGGAGLAGSDSIHTEGRDAAPIADWGGASVIRDAIDVATIVEEQWSDASSAPLAEEGVPMEVATLTTIDPVQDEARILVPNIELVDECLVVDTCIEEYLWAAYARTKKIDTAKVVERTKLTVKKNGKTRTVVRSSTMLVDQDFTWKDPNAAERAGMSMKDYVLGGMDRSFKIKLFRLLRALDEAGFAPGITSGFRDNYRQSIASGLKAASDRSYHGGSLRGGYGHGLAADLVSVRGETRGQRWLWSEALWKWVDQYGAEYGVGRPYLDRDPPHVGPIDGKEYTDRRGRAKAQHAKWETNTRSVPASETGQSRRAASSAARPSAPRAREASVKIVN
jgi:hypothetical protein